MANPWNTTSSIKKEPELLEIMSEELSQRLQIEDDFVWVNLQEVQQLPPVASPDVTTKIESSIAQNFGELLQSEVSVAIKMDDTEANERIYYDEDFDIYQTDEKDEVDEVDDWECKIDYERPGKMGKIIYSKPQWMKKMEHGTSGLNSSDNKNQNNKKLNPLLPEIKFGASTTAVLERLIDNRYLGQYNEVIGRGKNSIVFHADCHRRNCMTMPVNNAVKIYKLSSNKEKDKLIFKRVQREFEHLSILSKYNRTAINPIRAWENVIVMSLIGFNRTTALSIQNLPLHIDTDTRTYLAIVSFMHECYNVKHLVHGKLCAQNIRYWFERPHFIGWGHSVKTDHPRALPKLIRDCNFVTKFYAERGLKVKSTEDLFKEITGCSKISSKLLEVINNKDLYDIYVVRDPFVKKSSNNDFRGTQLRHTDNWFEQGEDVHRMIA